MSNSLLPGEASVVLVTRELSLEIYSQPTDLAPSIRSSLLEMDTSSGGTKNMSSLSEVESARSSNGGVFSTIEERRSCLKSERLGVQQLENVDCNEAGESNDACSVMKTGHIFDHSSPSPSHTSLLKEDSDTHENDEVSSTDVESDSGIESGGHSGIVSSDTQSKSDTVSTDSSESDEEERIDRAILHLDVKVDRSQLNDEALELLKLIPEGYILLPHQVAGHNHVNGKPGFLRKANHNDILYKPVLSGKKGLREVMFYEGLFDPPEETLSRDMQRLKKLIPGYYGVCDIRDRAGETHQFIKLEDVTSRFNKPSILDIKVRRRHCNDSTDVHKIEKEKTKYPLQEVLGFRIAGMRVYQSATDKYSYFDKHFGQSVSVGEVLESLRVFFLDGSHKRSDAIAAISDRLYEFLDWIETQASYKLFATSLLIIYEGDLNQPIKSPDQLVDVRWVDFAYACDIRHEGKSQLTLDENVFFGVKTFMQFLERLK